MQALQEVAVALNHGLLMSDAEKLERHSKLHKVVTTHTSHTWAAVLVKMLLGRIHGRNEAHVTPYLPKRPLEESYKKSSKRLFLFDYDVCVTLLPADFGVS
jgi:trehalose 6-phosphate synthase/phosphatase